MNDTFLLSDGLIVTFVAMFIVFIILASIWGLMEIVHKMTKETTVAPTSREILGESEIEVDKNREMVATLMALIYAYEEKPAKKYEIIEIKRIK